ncbi:MAG: DUF4864 domain-containing protein [Aestuariivirga sp.]
MKRVFLILTIIFAATSALAQDNPAANETYKAIITHQLQAIAQDDAAGAYSEAAPNVQKIFPSPDIFMNMVHSGYPPVYRNKQYSFGEAGVDANGRPFQKVEILGMDGVRYEGIYFMERQPDGNWKISGVVMGQVEGSDA